MSAYADSSIQAMVSCDKPSHNHTWPTSGALEIERCEHYCLFCRGPKALKKWSSAWFLRRHVRETHAKMECPGLVVSEGWSKRPTGNTRPISKKQRAPGSNKKRNGTKKEHAALIKMCEQALQLSKQASPQQHAQVNAAVPQQDAVGHLPYQHVAGTALMLPIEQSSTVTPWLSEEVALNEIVVTPSMLEIRPATFTPTDDSAEDSIDVDEFINYGEDDVHDSALGTSIASSQSVTDKEGQGDISARLYHALTGAMSGSEPVVDGNVAKPVWDTSCSQLTTAAEEPLFPYNLGEFDDLFADDQFPLFTSTAFGMSALEPEFSLD